MKQLKAAVLSHCADIRPASASDIEELKNSLGFSLSNEYLEYLTEFGVIAYEAYETYGLGIPKNSFLHVFNAYQDLSKDKTYPSKSVPILELGDGHYFLYDNLNCKVILWATPNGGVVRELGENLEYFLLKKIFND